MNNKNVAVINGVRGYVDDKGTAWLNAEDVARGFGFVQNHIKNGKQYTSLRWVTVNAYLRSFGLPHQVGEDDYIPENMVYRLGFKASNEVAQAFQAKLADEVIPSIRKHGAYMTDETLEQALLSPDFLIKLATELKKEKEERQRLEGKVQEMTPKVNFATALLQDDNACITLGDYARHIAGLGYPVSVKTIHKLFRDKGWLLSSEKNWNKPTQEMITAGYLTSREKLIYCNDGYGRMGKIVIVPLITPKGQEYFMQKLGVL